MANKIFEAILNRKIENFLQAFIDDSKSIFYRDDALFHPGEYGKYREDTLKQLIALAIDSKYKISSGFVINQKDEVSTQCDVVIYDPSDLPLLNLDISQFFTVESVLAIGEVKSDLNISQFKNALLKLAKNKMLRDTKKALKKKPEGFNKEAEYIFSFLVCRKLNFNTSNINFNEIYGDVSPVYRHNLILSIEDGLLQYIFPFNQLPEPIYTRFKNLGAKMDSEVDYQYPIHQEEEVIFACQNNIISIELENKLRHIRQFLICLSFGVANSMTYQTELLGYTSEPQANVWE